ncbi:MAG: GNAT family N-acetyltransferase [Phycisphaeraceae bacterium]|nr:GNAT family N-acetyltransferase [Phycisphaeraceae bacterium]
MKTHSPNAPAATLLHTRPHHASPVQVEAGNPLRGERLTLRILRESDRDEYIRVLVLSRHILQPSLGLWHPGESDADVFARHLRLAWEGETHAHALRRIAVLPCGRIAGAFNLISLARGLRFEAQMNWWVSADQLRRGIGREGACLLADHATADFPVGMGLHTLSASIMPSHQASRRIAAAAGFVQTSERETVLVDGRWIWHERWVRQSRIV